MGMTRWCNLRRFWLRRRLCRPSTHSWASVRHPAAPSFSNGDTPLPPGPGRFAVWCPQLPSGTRSPLPTSSKRNALNSGWWSGLDAGCPGEQATDTNTPQCPPSGFLPGPEVSGGTQPRPCWAGQGGEGPRVLGLASAPGTRGWQTARAGMPVPQQDVVSKSQYWPRRPRRGRQARGQSW